MPELPEVETICRGLITRIKNKKIIDIEILSPKSFLGDPDLILDQPVLDIKRRAKNIHFIFPKDVNILVHLKMTGQLIYINRSERLAGGHPSHDWHDKLPNSHTRVVFTFEDGSRLFFNDLRKFGWCKVLTTTEIENSFAKYGPEPFSKDFNLDYLLRLSKRFPNRKIKPFIMDQAIIAGIGNIYADESLYAIKIHPATSVKHVTPKQWGTFIVEIKDILNFSIDQGGTTDSDYVNIDGEIGGMQNFLKVYHKTGQKCGYGCGCTIERIVIGGRGTNFCPCCQKEVR